MRKYACVTMSFVRLLNDFQLPTSVSLAEPTPFCCIDQGASVGCCTKRMDT